MWYTSIEQLRTVLSMTDAQAAELRAVTARFPMRIPDYYLGLADPADPRDPIRRMCVPDPAEAEEGGSFDTSGEQSNTPIPGLQHKYRQTAVVLVTNRCAIYCRHCFRKRLVGTAEEEIAKNAPKITEYIRSHPEINNVLLSGGDSFMLGNDAIEKYLEILAGIDHLQYIRFGTRVPVTWPRRVDRELCMILSHYGQWKPIYVVTQFNHPREITPQSWGAVDALRAAGCIVRNQTVLLRGVNDDPAVLAELLARLSGIGVIPYYIFQCRPVTGVKNRFQVPMAEGIRIVENAKRSLSGMDKSARYCLSHPMGKLEILHRMDCGDFLLRFHEARDSANCGLVFSHAPTPDGCWFPEKLTLPGW